VQLFGVDFYPRTRPSDLCPKREGARCSKVAKVVQDLVNLHLCLTVGYLLYYYQLCEVAS